MFYLNVFASHPEVISAYSIRHKQMQRRTNSVVCWLCLPVLSEEVNNVKRRSIYQSDCEMKGCLPLFLKSKDKVCAKSLHDAPRIRNCLESVVETTLKRCNRSVSPVQMLGQKVECVVHWRVHWPEVWAPWGPLPQRRPGWGRRCPGPSRRHTTCGAATSYRGTSSWRSVSQCTWQWWSLSSPAWWGMKRGSCCWIICALTVNWWDDALTLGKTGQSTLQIGYL